MSDEKLKEFKEIMDKMEDTGSEEAAASVSNENDLCVDIISSIKDHVIRRKDIVFSDSEKNMMEFIVGQVNKLLSVRLFCHSSVRLNCV